MNLVERHPFALGHLARLDQQRGLKPQREIALPHLFTSNAFRQRRHADVNHGILRVAPPPPVGKALQAAPQPPQKSDEGVHAPSEADNLAAAKPPCPNGEWVRRTKS